MICLTFDTDWMSNSAMEQFLREFPIPGEATFFLHDAIPSLLRTDHEICPHPFINDFAHWQHTLETLTAKLPRRPLGVRPHSCVFSHAVGVGLNDMGFRYVSQASALYQTGIVPTRHPWGIWEMPIYYMDNMDFWTTKNWPDIEHKPFSQNVIDAALEQEGLFVFDFHPLHIALNTRNHTDYGDVKDKIIQDRISPFELAFSGRGTRTFFLELCSAIQHFGHRSMGCWSALKLLGCN